MIEILLTKGGPMKRLLPTVPLILFFLLNACGNDPGGVAPAAGTAVGETQTASVWTPTVTSTPDPNESKIVDWLNAGLSDAEPLEKMIDAEYQVQDVWFSPSNNSTLVFRVDIRCQCPINTQCCVPERIFIESIRAMKKKADKILEQVPGNVSELKVVCFNNGIRIAVVAALWSDAKGYLLDQLNGYQFGSRVYRSSIP
jgi:hypothetical protein